MPKKKLEPLEPPDLKRCQSDITTYNPWVMGGRVYATTRCDKVSTWLARETKAGTDGRKGSMALCAECKVVCAKKMPNVKFTRFKPYVKGKKK